MLSVSSGSSFVEANGEAGEQVATGEKKHWPGKVFKSVIFSAISLSWCVASGLTGRPALGEHELVQGLSLSSPLISAHHLHPGRFMERIKESRVGRGGAGENVDGDEARRSTRIPSLPNVEGRLPFLRYAFADREIHR